MNTDTHRHMHTHTDTDAILTFCTFWLNSIHANDTNFIYGTTQIYTRTDTQTCAHT